jgi:hypothetical protein
VNWLLIGLALTLTVVTLTQIKSGWRSMILIVIPVGFLQEPVRKLTTGQPVTMQLWVVFVFGISMLIAMSKFGTPNILPLAGKSAKARHVLIFFIAITIIQAFHSLLRFGTPIVPMIGLLSYLLPIPALWVAYHYARSAADIRRFLKLYALVSITTTLSVIISFTGLEDPVFNQVGDAPMVVYHDVVGVVQLYCGFMRTPEVAAWHAAAGVCAAITVAVAFKDAAFRFTAPFIALSGFMIVVLTGRRKALAVMALYAVLFVTGLLLSKRRSARSAAVASLAVAIALFLGTLVMAPDSQDANPHMERSATAFGDAWERFEQLGIGTISRAYMTGGFLGLGTGAGAQGTQHIAGTTVQGSAEGGLGRIMLELGVPGLILVILCSVAVAGTVRRCMRDAYHQSDQLYRLELGAIAFVGANVPVFIGAAQIFGDPFVLLILGMNLGFVLAVPKLIKLEKSNFQRAVN